MSAEEINTNVATLNAVQLINRSSGAVQNWIAGLPPSPVRDFLQQGLVFVRGVALSLVGVRVGKQPSCVFTGNCSGQDFSGQDLTGLWGGDVNFTGAIFIETTLDYAHFSFSKLTGVNMTGAKATGVFLTYLSMYGAILTGAKMRSASFTGADMTGVDLSYADLSGASFLPESVSGVIWYQTTCPNGTVQNTACTA